MADEKEHKSFVDLECELLALAEVDASGVLWVFSDEIILLPGSIVVRAASAARNREVCRLLHAQLSSLPCATLEFHGLGYTDSGRLVATPIVPKSDDEAERLQVSGTKLSVGLPLSKVRSWAAWSGVFSFVHSLLSERLGRYPHPLLSRSEAESLLP